MVYAIVATFIAFDFVTGIAKAFKHRDFNSSIMREGLFHKLGSVFAVTLGVLVDYAQGYIDVGVTVPVAGSICGYIVLMEIGSICENIGKINPELIPEKIRPFFGKLHTTKEDI